MEPKRGGWSLMGALRASGNALTSASRHLSEAASNYAARGSKERALPIDEASRDWRRRSGRTEGAETYEHGDLCRTVFRRALALSPREREVMYCGAVLLVGILEAEGLRPPQQQAQQQAQQQQAQQGSAGPDAYVSISLEDAEGNDVRAEHALTRTVPAAASAGGGGSVSRWDEVVAVGQKIPSFDDVKRVRLSVKGYSRGLLGAKSERLGLTRLSLEELCEEADAGEAGARGAWAERWLNLGEGARLKVFLLFHRPPTLPVPLSIGVLGTAGYALGGPEASGSGGSGGSSGSGSGSDSSGHYYLSLTVVNRLGERVKDASGERMARLRGANAPAARGGGGGGEPQQTPFCDLFELHEAEAGGAPEEVAVHGRYGPWGWAAGRPKVLGSAPPALSASCALGEATALQVTVFHTGLVADQAVGEVTVPLTSLWGHEDTVAHDYMLRCARWWKLEPARAGGGLWGGGGGGGGAGAGAGAGAGGAAGQRRPAKPPRVFLDIVCRYDAPLLPPGWTEAVSAEVGEVYFYHDALGAAQWTPPQWREAAFENVWERGEEAGGSSAGSSSSSSAAVAAAEFAALHGSGSGSGSGSGAGAGSYTSVLLRESARGRTASETWGKASSSVEGACPSISRDLLPGDAPHKPPRPRAPPEAGSGSGSGSGAPLGASRRGSIVGAAGAAAAGASSSSSSSSSSGAKGLRLSPRALNDGGGGGGGSSSSSVTKDEIMFGGASAGPSGAVEPFSLASPMALNKLHSSGRARERAATAPAVGGSAQAAQSQSRAPTAAAAPAPVPAAPAAPAAPAQAAPAPAPAPALAAPPSAAASPAASTVSALRLQPAPAPAPAPARVPVPAAPVPGAILDGPSGKSGGGGGVGGGEEEEEGGEGGAGEEEALPPALSREELDSVASGGKKGAARAEAALLSVPDFSNPLAASGSGGGGGSGSGSGSRDSDFFHAMAKGAAEKKAAQEAATKAKLASMSPEELQEYQRDQAAEAKRELRRERMLSTQMTAYGSGQARAAAIGGRGRGRGRGRGGASASAGGGFGGAQAW